MSESPTPLPNPASPPAETTRPEDEGILDRLWRRFGKLGQTPRDVAVILAVVTAIPNLLTLTIVLGTSNAAHAGERTLDTSAPGFRGATALGAIIAVVLVALLVFVVVRRSRRRRVAALPH